MIFKIQPFGIKNDFFKAFPHTAHFYQLKLKKNNEISESCKHIFVFKVSINPQEKITSKYKLKEATKGEQRLIKLLFFSMCLFCFVCFTESRCFSSRQSLLRHTFSTLHHDCDVTFDTRPY